MAVKSKTGNESVSIWLEQGNTSVFNIANLFVISDENYIVVHWEHLAHRVRRVGFRYYNITWVHPPSYGGQWKQNWCDDDAYWASGQTNVALALFKILVTCKYKYTT